MWKDSNWIGNRLSSIETIFASDNPLLDYTNMKSITPFDETVGMRGLDPHF